jgi:hypothetical protein
MPEGKIQVTVGAVSFSGEGERDWLAEQLDKVLKAAPDLASAPSNSAAGRSQQFTPVPKASAGAQVSGTLASHIKTKGGESSQVKRFLATADWLRLRGETELTTAKISKALADNHQKKLGNAADCLNQNVGKGHCEKQGKAFFITPDGLKALGYPE